MAPHEFHPPMLATAGRKPFTSADYVWEIKFDGYRCMAHLGADRVQLRTKSGADCSAWYPEVVQALRAIAGAGHVIDGEAAVLDDLGRSDFNRMHERSSRRRWYAGCPRVTFCAFDLLYESGTSVMQLPLLERKARLQRLLAGVPGVLFVGHLPARAELFAQIVEPLKLEGIVAKLATSKYLPGIRSAEWLKLKRAGWQEGRKWRGWPSAAQRRTG